MKACRTWRLHGGQSTVGKFWILRCTPVAPRSMWQWMGRRWGLVLCNRNGQLRCTQGTIKSMVGFFFTLWDREAFILKWHFPFPFSENPLSCYDAIVPQLQRLLIKDLVVTLVYMLDFCSLRQETRYKFWGNLHLTEISNYWVKFPEKWMGMAAAGQIVLPLLLLS